jgi:hypothetical protein
VSVLTGNNWGEENGPAARAELAGGRKTALADKLAAVRDTLIVLSMQVAFRIATFLRHLNY